METRKKKSQAQMGFEPMTLCDLIEFPFSAKNVSCSTSTKKDSVKGDMVSLHSRCIPEILTIFASFEFNFVFYHTQSFHSYAKDVLKGLKTLIRILCLFWLL